MCSFAFLGEISGHRNSKRRKHILNIKNMVPEDK
jgi:hypothetical protein